MAILITGHKGFIGQNMVAALPGAVGHEWGDGHWSLDGIDRVIHLGAISSTACTDDKKLREQNIDSSIDLLYDVCRPQDPVPVRFIGRGLRAGEHDLS
jgi:nucleoside-diphosphate-sugar epimerase